jgi:RNA polymerase sigma-70 factor (ECF subfamily)
MESVCASAGPSPRWASLRDLPIREAEESLIQSALKGRSDAFGDLVQPYLTSLIRFARARLGCESEAEDIVQQAVLRAFSHLGQFRHEASFRTWLGAIALNEVIHWRREQGEAPTRSLHETYAAKLADPASSPHAQCQRREEAERLRQAITGLPEKYRQMIQLRDLHELSVAETACSLSLTAGAVKTRHHRARKLLVRTLAGTRPVAKKR